MEFKFRAGEDRSSSYVAPSSADGYFTAQALRAGYIGGDIRRPDLLPNPMIPAREALRRELEKERIREEIIAREILRKRELEEEVRRELAYEREIALRRQAGRFSLAGGPLALHSEPQRLLLPPPSSHGAGIVDRLPLSSPRDVGVLERLSVSGRHDVGVVERLPISGRHDAGIGERLPVQRLLELRESEVRPASEAGNARVVSLGKSAPSPIVAGAKRKSAVELAQFTSPKKVKKEWFCALCEVSTTSEVGLNEHLQGKKHQAKEVELRASKPGGNNKGSSSPTQKKANKAKLVKQGVTTDGQQKLQVDQPEQQVVAKKENDIVNKLPLHCEHCKVKCNSESMFTSHMSGKKHLARMRELERGKAPVTKEKFESGADGKVVRVVKVKQSLTKQGKEEVSSETVAGVPTDGAVKTSERTKEEVLKVNKPGVNNKGPTPKTDKSKLVKKVMTSKVQQKPRVDKTGQQKGQKKQNGVVKKHPIRCEHCKVKCNSELMLDSHLRGKKHLARMQELESGKAALVIGAKECGKVDAAVTGGNEKNEADGKVVEKQPQLSVQRYVVKVKQGCGKQGKEEVVASETTEGALSTEETAKKTEAPSDEKEKMVMAEEMMSSNMEVKKEKD